MEINGKMLADFKTPERIPEDSLFPGSESGKGSTDFIFSVTSSKSRRSCLSEKRYNSSNPKPFTQTDPVLDENDIKSSKLLTFEPGHARKISHTRQRSIGDIDELSKLQLKKEASTRNTSKVMSICTEDSRSPSHLRNISDADSVVYISPEENKCSLDIKPPPFMFGKENRREELRGSMNIMGNTPCTAYCRYCKVDVHTTVELYNAGVSGGVLKFFSSVFTCCSGPLWLNNLKVHKCPQCSLVLAKCR